MSALILEAPLPFAPTPASWAFALTHDGETVAESGQAAPALLPRTGRGTQTVLVIPAPALSWHRVPLPQVSLRDRARLRAVLAGLLEDQLLDDPAQLHFALAPDARAGAPAWVAVCRADWLRAQLQQLQDADIAVHRIVPAFAPASASAPAEGADGCALHAIGSEDAPWLVATGAAVQGGVLCVPLAPAAAALQVVAQAPASLPVHAEPAVYQLAQTRLKRPVQLQAQAQRLLQASATDWSLAQFQFANSGRDRLAQGAAAGLQTVWRAPQWRWARWGAAVLLMGNLAGLNVWAWQARADLAQERSRITQIFRATFPQVPVVVDAPLQMRQELQRLQRLSGALTPGAFTVLASAVHGLPEGQVPRTISYEAQQLVLGGLDATAAPIAQWQAALAERGFTSFWSEDGRLHIAPVPERAP